MDLTQSDCEEILEGMAPLEQARFLAILGHWLTVVSRGAYVVQSNEVRDPRLLRALNEIHHRIYAQIKGFLSRRSSTFPADVMASWLAGEGEGLEVQQACLWAFKEAHRRYCA
jgi:hypothetical protein